MEISLVKVSADISKSQLIFIIFLFSIEKTNLDFKPSTVLTILPSFAATILLLLLLLVLA